MAGDPEKEYLDVSANMRQYGNMRFAQLTLFVGITAALLNVISAERNPTLPVEASSIIKGGGLLAAFIFWIMEESAANYWHHYKKRAEDLEEKLEYDQYKSRVKHWQKISATWAVRLFYGAIALFWGMWLDYSFPYLLGALWLRLKP